jgi:superfamily II DNA/RNA helicase
VGNTAISFAELGINPELVRKLDSRSITEATDIQRKVVPPILRGEDVLFRSATGTGKTFAYLLPLLQNLLISPRSPLGPELLICAPTYELCAQIKKEADFLLEGTGVKAALLMGSANISRQIDTLKKEKPRLVVGNPGRLNQLIRMGKLRFMDLRFLVLDEADRLIAQELFSETAGLIERLPKNRCTIACSATLNERQKDALSRFMKGTAQRQESEDNYILRERIEHWAFFAEDRRKISTLRSFIHAVNPDKTLVFTEQTGQIGNIMAHLQYHKIAAAGLFGDLAKQERKKALDDFRTGRVRVLVTSDLGARGLDVPDITHIVELDVPALPDSYAHRAGRTARAGRHGVMATIGNEKDLPRLAQLEKKLGIVVYPKALFRGHVVVPDVETTE